MITVDTSEHNYLFQLYSQSDVSCWEDRVERTENSCLLLLEMSGRTEPNHTHALKLKQVKRG